MGAPVKVFWVEPSGNVEMTFLRDGAETKERFPKAEADRLWDLHTDNGARCYAPLYRLPDGTDVLDRNLPPGAVRDADYLHDSPNWCGADGLSLVVRLPNGHDWHIDSIANNCTRRGEPHKCWCRHGDPRVGPLHVDKNGNTCRAGAGSIMSGTYHGFLHNGYLVDC